MTTQIHPLHRAKVWVTAGAVLAVLAALAGGFAAAPAQALQRTSFKVVARESSNPIPVAGHFIWYNRSVRVGGSVGPSSPVRCAAGAAVVFTAYDGHGHKVARAARPGNNNFTCFSLGYGFTLDAHRVRGGIRKIVVDLWENDFHRHGRAICVRGRSCTN